MVITSISYCSGHSCIEQTWSLLNFETFLFFWLSLGDLHHHPIHFFHGYAVGIILIPLFSLLLPLYYDVSAVHSVLRFPLAIKALLVRWLAFSEACIFGKLSSCTRSIELNAVIAIIRRLCSTWSICKSSQCLFTDTAGSPFIQGLSSLQGLSPPSDSSSEGVSSSVVSYVSILMQSCLRWLPFQL